MVEVERRFCGGTLEAVGWGERSLGWFCEFHLFDIAR